MFSVIMPPLPQVPGPSHLSSGPLADLAVATFHRGIKLEDLAKYIVAAPSMQGTSP